MYQSGRKRECSHRSPTPSYVRFYIQRLMASSATAHSFKQRYQAKSDQSIWTKRPDSRVKFHFSTTGHVHWLPIATSVLHLNWFSLRILDTRNDPFPLPPCKTAQISVKRPIWCIQKKSRLRLLSPSSAVWFINRQTDGFNDISITPECFHFSTTSKTNRALSPGLKRLLTNRDSMVCNEFQSMREYAFVERVSDIGEIKPRIQHQPLLWPLKTRD